MEKQKKALAQVQLEKLSECPVCKGSDFTASLTCKDYTYSQVDFSLVDCKSCGFKFTNPRPTASTIGNYYQSEDYVSHSDTQEGLVNKLYHLVRTYTLQKKLQLIFKLRGRVKKQGKTTLLDIGCGTGAFLSTCVKAGFEGRGIEPDTNARAFAQNNYGLQVDEEAALELFSAGQFDVISLWHVLEHVPDLDSRMKKIKHLLAERGHLIIAVPNCDSYDANYYGKFWAAYDVPRHLYHFTPATLAELAKRHQFKLEQVLPMVFDSFYVSMLSEQYKNGKSNFIGAIWRGFLSNLKAIKTGKQYSSQIYILRHES